MKVVRRLFVSKRRSRNNNLSLTVTVFKLFLRLPSSVTMPVPTPEALQHIILQNLEASGSIPDSRELAYNGRLLQSVEEQGVVRAVLDSLASKEVRTTNQIRQNYW